MKKRLAKWWRAAGTWRHRILRPAARRALAPCIVALVLSGLAQAALATTDGDRADVPKVPAPLPLPSAAGRGRWALAPAFGLDLAPIDDLAQQLEAAWNAQDWPQVLLLIEQIMAIDPNYDEIQDKKYFAHVNYGYQLMTEGRCTESLDQFRKALEVRPNGQEATAGLDLLVLYCGTPPPALTPSVTPLSTITPYVTPTPTFITPFPPAFPTLTPSPIVLTEPIEYVVQPGDTLFSLAQRYSTTVQAIMQANGMMSFFLRAGDTIIIPPSQVVPVGPLVHIVQPGETLQSIAALYNTTVFAIKVMNNLPGNTIFAFQALFIPSAQLPGAIVHIVQPGETLFSIAQNYGTTVPLIMLANNFKTFTIHVYQRVIIPPDGWTGYPPIQIWTGPARPFPKPHFPPAPHPAPRKHLVQPGDTLFSIALRYGTTVQAIKAANGLVSDRILAGTYLIIP
ncbi:MAG: LysM peptidoglycan-binding domain-containing protein [Chloroflexi bacterium]|nr:LysM peptidoglycan-binding domain-containing protein [Chloroflexota bacterium]